jgi:glycosyltransferase involved in cell wall biosynthesis
MKHIAVILNGAIINDSRVIKTIQTISRNHCVDLFYASGNQGDSDLFNNNVRLFLHNKKDNLKTKIIQHSLFYNEFLFFVKTVINTGVQYDYIWANDLPCLKPAIKLKHKIKAKVIYDSHEIYIETLNQFFPQNPKGIKKVAFKFILGLMRFSGRRAEKQLLKDVDYFITVGQELKKYFESQYHFIGIKVMMNCPKTKDKVDHFQLKNMLGIEENDTLFIYQGVLNNGRGLKMLVESFKLVNNKIFLLILGSGMLKEDLINDVKNAALENKVFFLNQVNNDVLASYTLGADFGINLLEDLNLSKKYAVPNKLFEYIHAGIPVISSNSPESKAIYNEYKIGKLVNNNPSEIADAINGISNEDLSMYKMNCKEAAKVYNWENQEKILYEIFN